MALNIKNPRVERLAQQVAAATGETKTEAIRRALEERMQRLTHRLGAQDHRASLLKFLEREVWPPVSRRGGRRDAALHGSALGHLARGL